MHTTLIESIKQSVQARRGDQSITVELVRPHRLRIGPAPGAYPLIVPALVEKGGRVGSLVTTDERGEGGGFRLRAIVLLDHAGLQVEVIDVLGDPAPVLKSLTRQIPAVHWQERECAEMFGLELSDHPEPYRRLLHDGAPAGFPPLRKDTPSEPGPGSSQNHPLQFRRVRGEGVCEIPVGPIHAGIIEPGHFRFFVMGERIINLQIDLGWQHKGTEKLFEGLRPSSGVHLAERISGDTTFGHSLAYCLAVEDLTREEIPLRAIHLRALALELERLANHVGDLGGLSTDVGYAFGASHFGRLRGAFLNKSEELCGNRYLRGFCRPGGVNFDLDPVMRDEFIAWLPQVRRDYFEVSGTMFSSDSVRARFDEVGKLAHRQAVAFGMVGPAARASGIHHDIRWDYHCAPYPSIGSKISPPTSGDVQARASIRHLESMQSLTLIERLLDSLPPGPISTELPRPRARELGIGQVEAWRGEILTGVMLDEEGRLARVRVRDPSVQNWIGLAMAAESNLVSDFPLCNKSFNLSYSGSDL